MTRTNLGKIIALVMTVVLIVGVFSYSSVTAESDLATLKKNASELTNEVNNLKKQKASQDAQKKAVEKQIAATQALINACNAKIAEYNSKISNLQAQINEKNKEIDNQKKLFKKRIRALYMSNSQSDIQILLGAESFSDYLSLAQMTKSVSAHDKALVDEIVDTMKVIEANKSEIADLNQQQINIKSELTAQKNNLTAQENSISSLISATDADIKKAQKDLSDTQNAILRQSAGTNIIYDGNGFVWPVAGYYYISAGINSADSVHNGTHKGIDIAGGGISGKPVRAAASGTVYLSNGSCTHNYKKNYSCGCGGGYGNYVAIDHGQLNGNTYKTLYGHMSSITVSKGQHVEKGQVIGYVGTTGWSTGPHLHFEFIVNGGYKDARNYGFQG